MVQMNGRSTTIAVNLMIPDYSRQLKVPGMTAAAQERLQKARILAAGAGGLGTTALPYLAAAGIGHITIVDHDVIESSNLHRQLLYTYADIGRSKAAAAADYCRARSAAGSIAAIARKLLPSEWLALAGEHDLILDCTDDSALAHLLCDAALVHRKPAIFANAASLEGQLFIMRGAPDEPCWHCVWPENLSPAGSCSILGVLGPVPGVLGCLQALAAIKLLAGLAINIGELQYVDFAAMRLQPLQAVRQTRCPHSLTAAGFRQKYPENHLYPYGIDHAIAAGLTVIDIRRPEETASQPHERARQAIEMTALLANPSRWLKPDAPYLLLCQSGRRARTAAAQLQAQGWANVFALP